VFCFSAADNWGMKNKTLYNLHGLAIALRLPVKWLAEQAEAGNIPCLFIGKRQMRFNIDAVEKAIAAMAEKVGGDGK